MAGRLAAADSGVLLERVELALRPEGIRMEAEAISVRGGGAPPGIVACGGGLPCSCCSGSPTASLVLLDAARGGVARPRRRAGAPASARPAGADGTPSRPSIPPRSATSSASPSGRPPRRVRPSGGPRPP